jgi:ribonuclease P protein component
MRGYGSLRRRSEFSRVHRRGRRRSGAYLTTLVAEGGQATRVGLVVSTAVGDAVRRNRLRRRLRALLDRYGFEQPPFRDVVVIARPGAAELDFDELAAELERTFGPRP